MILLDAYKYCPLCKGDFIVKSDELLVCSLCDYQLYLNPKPCNAVIIENDKGEILLVKRKFDPFKGYWDLPGGFISIGESFEDSVKREVKEELGISIAVERCLGGYPDTYEYENITYNTIIFTAVAKLGDQAFDPKDDVEDAMFFSKNQVLNQQIAFTSLRKIVKDYLS